MLAGEKFVFDALALHQHVKPGIQVLQAQVLNVVLLGDKRGKLPALKNVFPGRGFGPVFSVCNSLVFAQ